MITSSLPAPSRHFNRCRQLRKRAGISLMDLAELAAVSRFRLWQAETGRMRLRPAEAEAVAAALVVPVGYVFPTLDIAA